MPTGLVESVECGRSELRGHWPYSQPSLSLLDLFDCSYFASFSHVFFSGFSITCPVRFLEVDVSSLRSINRGQLGVDGDEDGQIIAGQ